MSRQEPLTASQVYNRMMNLLDGLTEDYLDLSVDTGRQMATVVDVKSEGGYIILVLDSQE